MENIELDESAIKKSLILLKDIDFKYATINEIELLLTPLLNGYTASVPKYEPGIYLYRSRICNEQKPNFIAELSYPPAEIVTDYGRANDIGQPMFYGSISKNIPFFEIGAKLGDKLVISIWKTKTSLLLNHVGFIADVFNLLSSNREAKKTYEFVIDTQNINDLNAFVYNYLAISFTKDIAKHENHLYKLSIAIANHLIKGDLLNGIIYPTIAMNANSDNIVLKPSFVDENLEFVAVEYLQVTKHEGMSYQFKTIDTAIELLEGKLNWTGKQLGWSLETNKALSFNSKGDDWVATLEDSQRIDPHPTTPIQNNLSNKENLYNNSFPDALKLSNEISVGYQDEKIACKITLLLDFKQRNRSLAFYISKSNSPSVIAKTLIKEAEVFLKIDKDQLIETRIEATGELICTNNDLKFSNKIFIFSESFIDSIIDNYLDYDIEIINENL